MRNIVSMFNNTISLELLSIVKLRSRLKLPRRDYARMKRIWRTIGALRRSHLTNECNLIYCLIYHININFVRRFSWWWCWFIRTTVWGGPAGLCWQNVQALKLSHNKPDFHLTWVRYMIFLPRAIWYEDLSVHASEGWAIFGSLSMVLISAYIH